MLGGTGGLATYFALRRSGHDPFFDQVGPWGRQSLCGHEYHGMGIRTGKIARRSIVSTTCCGANGCLREVSCSTSDAVRVSCCASGGSRAAHAQESGPTGRSFYRASNVWSASKCGPSRTTRACGAWRGCGYYRIRREDRLGRSVPVDSSFRRAAHDAEADQDALLSAHCRGARAGRRHPGAGGRRVGRMAVSGGQIGNRLTALASRAWRQNLVFRTAANGVSVSSDTAWMCEDAPAGTGTPFANYLFRLTVRPAASAATVPREQSA